MDIAEKKTETKKPVSKTVHAPAPSAQEPRNFLVAFLLTTILGVLGLRHFYLGNAKLGWIRSGLFIGGYAWSILMAILGEGVLGILGFFAIITASIWALVDFFYVYNAVKVDADGQPLTATVRDRKWAKSIYVGAISLVVVSSIVALIAGVYIEQTLKNNHGLPGQNQQYPGQNSDFNWDQYMQNVESQPTNQKPSI